MEGGWGLLGEQEAEKTMSLSLYNVYGGSGVAGVRGWGTLAAWFPRGEGLWWWGAVPHFLWGETGEASW